MIEKFGIMFFSVYLLLNVVKHFRLSKIFKNCPISLEYCFGLIEIGFLVKRTL